MQRVRGSWFALIGASLMVLFSISVAVGADPETDTNRGQSISGFVHSLIFGEPDPDEELAAPDESEEDEDGDQAEEEEAPADVAATTDEATDEAVEANQDAEVTGAAHGACVAEVAQSDEVGGPNENHGGAVSEAARETCWQAQEPAPEETLTDPTVEQQEFKYHGECVSEVAHSDEVGGPNENHGGAVSQAARETCREAAPEASSTEVTVVDSGAQLGSGGDNGNGHGRGGGNGGGGGHEK